MRSEGYVVLGDRYYSEEHEWAKVEGGMVRVGVSDYAQKLLHGVVYVEVTKRVGESVGFMEAMGAMESVKAISDLHSPVSGRLVDVNEKLRDAPEILNDDPYGEGWIAIVSPSNLEVEVGKLMGAEGYTRYIERLEEEN
jgi:glycine cleavage system H protein